MAEAYVAGAPVDWSVFCTERPGERVDLPTYAFQHQRYWTGSSSGAAEASVLGQDTVDHPLLGAAITPADGDRRVFTSRLSLKTHPWLADHVALGTVLLPGTAFVELAVRAGDEVGCGFLEELTLRSPLVLPEDGSVQVQVLVGEPGDAGARTVTVHARSEDGDAPWTRCAEGVLADRAAGSASDLAAWPPPGAAEMRVDGAYELLQARGYDYGPAFQGLRAAWRRGDDVFAEVVLEEEAHADARRFGLHPALLDAALHATLLEDDRPGESGTVLPFVWNGVALHATGASALRVRLTRQGPEKLAIAVADESGAPVLSVESVLTRPVSPAQLAGAGGAAVHDSLFRVEWTPCAVPADAPGLSSRPWEEVSDGDDDVPDLVVLRTEPGSGLDAVHAVTHRVLAAVRQWLAGERFLATRLLVATRGAVALPGEDVADLAGAAVWGLVRSAQLENPGRILLVDGDLDQEDAPATASLAATGEPQLVIRGGTPHKARLARVPVEGGAHGDAPPAAFGPEGTVLVTGGLGMLGRLFARHLAERYGVRRLLLTGRTVPEDAAALRVQLADLGAEASIVPCDVGDRGAVAALLAGIDPRHPLRGVVHAAGTVDDGVIGSLTPERIDAVFRPKVDGAAHLHELTRDMDLSAFVLFSSEAGVSGSGGQGNYAAANAFLDGLAAHRRSRGLAGQSLAWGLWADDSGMTSQMSAVDRHRMRRSGIDGMTAEQGLDLFDRATALDDATVVPFALDPTSLATGAADLPPLFQGLVRGRSRRAAAGGSAGPEALRRRLAGVPAADRGALLVDLVRAKAATVLGHASPEELATDRAFREIGFDSLTALELRNQLNLATGLRLPATLVFDHPDAEAVGAHLADLLLGAGGLADAERTSAAPRPADGEPIAIVAMACRYPGGVGSPEDLWRLVAEGRDAITGLPADRGWDIDAIYDPEPGKAGKSYTRSGGFLHGAADFDPAFFGISPHDALGMDPQQRLLLETSWELLERAGIRPASLKGSRTGVFVGIMHHDYAGSSSAGAVASGVLSYTYGLEGPAMTVDTACSSSLVALHLAAQALRSGECSLALAGGATVMATSEVLTFFGLQRALAADGRCKSFADAADGTGLSEGAGMLLLERLSDARRLGHRVLAVVRGSAVNQDGASNGLTAPNGLAQQRVIRQALENAGLPASEVDVVEAHGTGTRLGDPIEAQALLATYGQGRVEGRPLWLGSLKSNMGHTQAAAGVAGVIKMVEAMRRGILPKTIHLNEPSREVDWTSGAVELLSEAREWPDEGRPRRAGVSSFGLTGTNAHVIVEQAPEVEGESGSGEVPSVVPLVLSARSEGALVAQAGRLADLLEGGSAPALVDVGYSLACARSVFEYRSVVVAGDRVGAVEALRGDLASVTRVRGAGKSAWVFTGQGAQ
ncbi:type I polyketide synthase, partial [Streptomyces sp. 5-10]|uniref:type I polyketide synthase n=1 Tax=Streptomyces sp. 5-10 TaxID=878925 RepID=UPI00168B23DF